MAAGESETEWQQERVTQNGSRKSNIEWQQERVRTSYSRHCGSDTTVVLVPDPNQPQHRSLSVILEAI